MALPVVIDFSAIPKEPDNSWDEFPTSRILFFSSNIYVLGNQLKLDDILSSLSTHMRKSGKKYKHLHVYCAKLELSPNVIDLAHDEQNGLDFQSVQIFAAELNTFNSLRFKTKTHCDVFLFYDTYHGPDSFYVDSAGQRLHVIIDDRFVECPPNCTHVAWSSQKAPGIKFVLADQSDSTMNNPVKVEPQSMFNPAELRKLTLLEYKTFGPRARLLRNLPPLLEKLFNSACVDLMGEKPNIQSVATRLRYVKRMLSADPAYVSFAEQAEKLLNRLRLPREIPQSSSQTKTVELDWYFTPVNRPEALKDSMKPTMDSLQSAQSEFNADVRTGNIIKTLLDTSKSILEAVKTSVGIVVTDVEIDHAVHHAANSSAHVNDAMAQLVLYEHELKIANEAFEAGMKAYQKAKQKQAYLSVAGSVFEVIASVGIAMYTGGAGLPLTVAKANQAISGVKKLVEDSTVSVALKSLASALVKIIPKMTSAYLSQQKFNTGNTVNALRDVGSKLRESMSEIRAGDAIDFGGLIAAWRELDNATVATFQSIRTAVAPSVINGATECEVASRALAVRGESLAIAMRIAYEARSTYFLLLNEKKAKENIVSNIESSVSELRQKKIDEKLALMCLRQEAENSLAQRRREVFVMMHEAILALLFSTNNMSFQKKHFSELSPARTTAQLLEHYSRLSDLALPRVQGQTYKAQLKSAEIFQPGWKPILERIREIPFEIPITLSDFRDQHAIRLDRITFSFENLKYTNGKPHNGTMLKYGIFLGPWMRDVASPSDDRLGSRGSIVQYYMPQKLLMKQGSTGDFVDDKGVFMKRGACCSGKIYFDPRDEKKDEALDLSTVTEVVLNLEYEAKTFGS